jgi:hypothetical protein
MARLMRPITYLLIALGVLCMSACRRDEEPDDPRGQVAEEFGRLPGLSETPNAPLRDELARITDEAATPELLAATKIPEQENVAVALADLFAPEQIDSVLEECREIFPSGQFKWSPAELQKAIRLRRQYDLQRRQAREALKRPGCSFRIQYEAGFAADLSFLDVAWICTRLEAARAAELLAADDLAGAIESLSYLFRLAACLAAEKHATVRLEAALMRGEALGVLQGIVEHPEVTKPAITRAQLDELGAMVRSQLKAWPSDADAWIGDRALGMCAYELVRAGRLMDLLTQPEWQQFDEEGILEELPVVAQRTVNQDELYYLQAMRRIIEGCRRPYHERKAVFAAIREDLQEKRNAPDFPLVAGRLLLPEIEQGHAIQARDRAACEVWALALSRAAGRRSPGYQVSPLTGSQYEVVEQEATVVVYDVGTSAEAAAPSAIAPNLAGPTAEP